MSREPYSGQVYYVRTYEADMCKLLEILNNPNITTMLLIRSGLDELPALPSNQSPDIHG